MNGGRTMHVVGPARSGATAGGIAVPPGRPEVITLTTAVYLDRSADGGKTWKTVSSMAAGRPGARCPTRARTWAGLSSAAYSALLRTTNAGATWHQVPIPAARARPVIAYVVNQGNCDGGHTVTPINTATNTALKAINVGRGPNAIAVTPTGRPPTSCPAAFSPARAARDRA